MPAYVIAEIRIQDPELFQAYARGVPATIAQYGGRYLVRGGVHKVVEGSWFPRRLVLLEFPSMEALQDFYLSPAYESLRALRQQCSTAHAAVAVEGIED